MEAIDRYADLLKYRPLQSLHTEPTDKPWWWLSPVPKCFSLWPIRVIRCLPGPILVKIADLQDPNGSRCDLVVDLLCKHCFFNFSKCIYLWYLEKSCHDNGKACTFSELNPITGSLLWLYNSDHGCCCIKHGFFRFSLLWSSAQHVSCVPWCYQPWPTFQIIMLQIICLLEDVAWQFLKTNVLACETLFSTWILCLVPLRNPREASVVLP